MPLTTAPTPISLDDLRAAAPTDPAARWLLALLERGERVSWTQGEQTTEAVTPKRSKKRSA